MTRANATLPRIHVEGPLIEGRRIALDRDASHRLLHVLRLGVGDALLLFDGASGEWRATLTEAGKRGAVLGVDALTRPQAATRGPAYAFAPLKQARLDYLIQKAVEMGAASLQPVVTRRTQVARLNHDRLSANAVEAAEQCGRLDVPPVEPERPLAAYLEALDAAVPIVFCDEAAAPGDPLAALARLPRGCAPVVLVGPEGGFTPEERALVLARRGAIPLSLGPRILRADTAAVAALALVQAALGDWSP